MKKLFYLLLLTAISLQAQTTGVNKLKITSNPEKNSATRVVVQDATTGEVGYVAKSSLTTDISGKENTITAGTTAQYWRGDKSWQTLPTYTLSGLGGEPSITAGTTAQYWRGDKTWQTLPTYTLSGLGGQPLISTGTTSQYWRGDKTWQTLDKTSIGLGNVDNTTDAGKPVSTATQTALNLKANLASPTFTGTVSGITKAMVGLSNVDNTTDANKPVSTATQTALDTKQNTLVSGTSIKTINGNSLLGSGDIAISGGGSTAPLEFNTTNLTVWNNGKGNIATNTSFGAYALESNTSGDANTAYGSAALKHNTSGASNVGIGVVAGTYDNNFSNVTNVSFSVFIGGFTKPLADNQTNQIVIGYDATGAGSNTATLGNTLITKTVLRGTINTASMPVFADNAEATAGGLSVGDQYRTSTGVLMVRF